MRWKCVVVALAVLASCEAAPEEAGEQLPVPAPPPSAPPVTTRRVELPVLADFSISPALPDTEVSTVRSPRLRAGKGGVAFFAVARPPVPVKCIAQVRLGLSVEGWTDDAAEELAVYPSQVVNALAKRNGDRFGYSGSLLDVRPRASFVGHVEGWAEWDVTAIVKRWVGSGVFPSRDLRVPRKGPVVLALRDAEGAEPLVRVAVGSTEAPRPPAVVARVEKECPARGRA